MVPYINLPSIPLGPVTIQPFGIMASASVGFSVWYAFKLAERDLRDGRTLLDMAPWFLFFGFFSAHLVSIVFYFPERLLENPFKALFDITSGLSSFGGMIGGALGGYIFMRREKLSPLLWFDLLARAFTLAFIFGRAGCSIAHDHPGKPTDFFLAVNYPARHGFPAGPRHDLGFYELWFWVLAFPLFLFLGKKKRPDGFFIGLLLVLYAPVRWGLDFLRTADTTYLGMTFAQYTCIAILPLGGWLLWRARKHPVFSTHTPYEEVLRQREAEAAKSSKAK